MSHELKDCYVTGQYEGHSCVFVIKVEATEDLSLVNADNFEDFLESHNYKVVKCQTDISASYLASQLMAGSLIVDYAGSDSDSIYVMLRDPAIYIENGSLDSLSKTYTEKLGIDLNVVAECEETGDTKVKVQDLSSPHSVSGVAYNPMKGINFK